MTCCGWGLLPRASGGLALGTVLESAPCSEVQGWHVEEGAAGSGWGELLIHGHKSAFRKAAEGLGRSCVPTFNSKPRGGGTQGLVPLPQATQWVLLGAQLQLLEVAQAEGHVPHPAVLKSEPGSAWHRPAPPICTRHQQRGPQRGHRRRGPRIRPHPQTGIARTLLPLPEAGARGQAAGFLWENCRGGAPSLTPNRSQKPLFCGL